VITVEGDIPSQIANGVYVYQCNQDGTIYADGWNNSQNWTSLTTATNLYSGYEVKWLFDPFVPDALLGTSGSSLILNWAGTINGEVEVTFNTAGFPGDAKFKDNNGSEQNISLPANTNGIVKNLGNINLTELKAPHPSGGNAVVVASIKLNGLILVDSGEYPSAPNLNFLVQSVSGQTLTGTANATNNFIIGKYLRVPE
jgi:hypothetical protein